MIHHAYRAGYINDIPIILEHMDSIDVTDVDTSLLGHSYYADNCTVLSDIFSLFNLEKNPSERFNLAKVESLKGIYWAFHLTHVCTAIIK